MSHKIGVIAVGGKGTRLGRRNTQKCLIQIEGKPLVEYTIEIYEQLGVEKIFLLTGFLHEQVEMYVRQRKTTSSTTVECIFGGVEGEVAAILKLQPLISGDFLYAGGDCIFSFSSLEKLIQDGANIGTHIAAMSVNLLTGVVPEHPKALLSRESKFIEKIVSPDHSGPNLFTVMGLYYFKPGVFEILNTVLSGSKHTSDFIKHAVRADKKVLASTTRAPWFCIHTQKDLARWRNSKMKKHLLGK